MTKTLAWIGLLATACGGKSTSLPIGQTASSGDDTATEANGDGDGGGTVCDDDAWNLNEAGVGIQPEVCLAWSPVSMETMTWYDAANLEEGEAGGCRGDDCPPDSEGYCDTITGLGDRTDWRLPTKRELMDAAQSEPQLPDLDGRLWTRDSADGATGNAWTVDFGRPGSAMSLGKDDDGIAVRCVSDS